MYTSAVALCVGMSIASSTFGQATQDEMPFRDAAGNLLPERSTQTRGETFSVFVDPCRFKEVKFEEKARKSRLEDDVRAVFGKLSAAGKEKLKANQCDPSEFTSKLQYERSKLTLTAVGNEEKDTVSMTVTTGPAEHWYLGIDLPLTSRKQLKYDSGTRTLQPQDDEPQLYLSLNWQWGDVLSRRESRWDLDRLTVKFLVLANNRPFDSVGLGVGYQMFEFSLFGKKVDLSAVNLFVGHFWTRQDAISGSGEPQINESIASDWRLGISYDVGAGLKYLK